VKVGTDTNKNKIFSLLSKIRGKAGRCIEKELLLNGIKGLESSHGAIIAVLYRNSGKLNMKEIADLIHRDKSTVTYLVKSLIREGYVIREKSNEDSRETYIVLTKKAWDIKDRFWLMSRKVLTVAYTGFSKEEQDILMQLLNRMDDNLPD
jgi:DNA-binding MarR family transcriptional regulator